MVPCNVIGSSIPGAIFRYRLHNRSDGPLTASIAFSLPNYIGTDRSSHEANCYATQHTYGPKGNVNEFRQDGGFCGIFLRSAGVPHQHSTWGTMALTTTIDDCTHRTG